MGVKAVSMVDDTGDEVLELVMKEPHIAGVFAWLGTPVLAEWSWLLEEPVSITGCLGSLSRSECCSLSSSCRFQLKPRPNEVTPQLFPTLAAR